LDRINLPASIQNLANVEKVQQREIHNPVNVSINNSVVDKERFDESQRQAVEVESGEDVLVDPDERRKQQQEQEEKRKKKRMLDGKNRGRNSGKFIDYSA